jgi:hypothetical protein
VPETKRDRRWHKVADPRQWKGGSVLLHGVVLFVNLRDDGAYQRIEVIKTEEMRESLRSSLRLGSGLEVEAFLDEAPVKMQRLLASWLEDAPQATVASV